MFTDFSYLDVCRYLSQAFIPAKTRSIELNQDWNRHISMIIRNKKWLACLIAASLTAKATAEITVINPDASPLEVSISAKYNDDLNPTDNLDNKAYGVAFSPKGQLIVKGEGTWFLADYEANLETYRLSDESEQFSDDQDFHDARVKLLSRVFITDAWHLDAQVQHRTDTQSYGKGISQLRNNVFETDRLSENSVALSLVYGNDTSQRFVAVKLYGVDQRYNDNNAYSELFEMQSQGVELDIAFRQSAVSSLLFRLEGKQEDFDSELRSDSNLYRALIGADWQPTGVSKLKILLGMFWRDFDGQESNSGLSWTLDYVNKPTKSWSIGLRSSRSSQASNNELTSDSVRQDVGVNIDYDYSEQWGFGTYFQYAQTEYEEPLGVRELDENKGGVSISLNLKEHSTISFSVGTDSVSSSDGAIDYRQNEAVLSWQLTL